MKLVFTWLLDLASNFRRHIAFVSLLIILPLMFFELQYLASVFFILIFYSLFPLNSWFKHETKYSCSSAKQYDVCSFNMEWNANNHQSALEYINHCSSDLLILQEVPETLTKVIHQYKNSFPFQYGEGHSHVMVLSKHHLELVEYLPWPGKFNQRAMHVLCHIDGQRLHVFAVHFQVTRTWKQISIRNQQIKTLLERMSNINEAMILVGDFNAGTGSKVVRMIERDTDLRSNESLLNFKSTWPSNFGVLGIQLDHIYASRKIRLNNLKLGPVLESDHRPIRSEFGFYDASANLS